MNPHHRIDPAYNDTFEQFCRRWHPAVASIEAHAYLARRATAARRGCDAADIHDRAVEQLERALRPVTPR